MTNATRPKPRLFTLRRLLAVVLVLMIAALAFDSWQRSCRDAAAESLFKYSPHPRRDPEDPRKIIALPNAEMSSKLREEIHQDVFGSAQPAEVSEDRRLKLKESWAFPGIFTNYVLDVTYELDTEDLRHPDSQAGRIQKYSYTFSQIKTRNLWHFESGPLILDRKFAPLPNWPPAMRFGG